MQTMLEQNLSSILFGYEEKIEKTKGTTAIITKLLQSSAINKENSLFLMTKIRN
jgi:hypothetical protein